MMAVLAVVCEVVLQGGISRRARTDHLTNPSSSEGRIEGSQPTRSTAIAQLSP